MSIKKHALWDRYLLLFINNYLHLLNTNTFNTTLSEKDKDQMSFGEKADTYSLLTKEQPFDAHDAKESWRRVTDFLDLVKQKIDLSELTAYVSLSDFLIEELRKIYESEKMFRRTWIGKFLQRLDEGSDLLVTYEDVYHLSLIIPTLRNREHEHVQKCDDDGYALSVYYGGCVDFCLIKNAARLTPVLKQAKEKYLQNFCDSTFNWDENIVRWEVQERETEKCLQGKEGVYGTHFWLDEHDFFSIIYRDEYRYVESLLKLQELQRLSFYCTSPNLIRGDSLMIKVELSTSLTEVNPDSSKQNPEVLVNGVSINLETQKVRHPDLGSHIFRRGYAPWKILCVCASEKDGFGKAHLDTVQLTDTEIHNKLQLINKHFAEPIVYYKNDFVYLDPDFKR